MIMIQAALCETRMWQNIQSASQIESLDRLVIRLNPALYNSMGENLLHVEVEGNQSLGSFTWSLIYGLSNFREGKLG